MKKLLTSISADQSGFRHIGIRAFTLVEVVLAMGIMSFALLAIVALLPAGIQSSKDSLQESAAINVLSQIISDRQGSPFTANSITYGVVPLTTGMQLSSNVFGVTDSNTITTAAALTQARYRVTYVITPPETGSLSPFQAYFRVSWPAPATTPAGYVDANVTFAQP